MASSTIPQLHLASQADRLLQAMATNALHEQSFSSMSTSIYDTAWVSMVFKRDEDHEWWVFPESFGYILRSQNSDGSWGSTCSSADMVLNTLSCLLSIHKHATLSHRIPHNPYSDLQIQADKATAFLKQKLLVWDSQTSRHVASEILVPAILHELQQLGVSFQMNNLTSLLFQKESRMKRFNPYDLYHNTPSVFLHSLEAFIGVVDFDRLSHHLVNGSMMGSPSSTAAYLIHSSKWDDDCEKYLRMVIRDSGGKGTGAVPSAFPTIIFEISWVLSTLIEGGLLTNLSDSKHLRILGDVLERHLSAQGGLVGFAPKMLADVDDTAKTIFTLNRIGKTTSAFAMKTEFETENYFKTYKIESNSSLSANCNVLISLLESTNPTENILQIQKATKYVCGRWWDNKLEDKWNLTIEYSMMLLSQALTTLLHKTCLQNLSQLSSDVRDYQVLVVLLQIMTRLLSAQQDDGSWGGTASCEQTSYAILALNSLLCLPLDGLCQAQVRKAIREGRNFLHRRNDCWDQEALLWIEKVTYGSSILCQAYCLSAMHVSEPEILTSIETETLRRLNKQEVTKYAQFFAVLPIFAEQPLWKLNASLTEGFLLLPQLQAVRTRIFQRKQMEEDKYLTYIPLAWTLSNNLNNKFVSNTILWEMTVISMINYQADEFMESVIKPSHETQFTLIEDIIKEVCSSSSGRNGSQNQAQDPFPEANIDWKSDSINGDAQHQESYLVEMRNTLSVFASYVLRHPKIQQATSFAQNSLKNELEKFLIAHLAQGQDNANLALQNSTANVPSIFQTSKYTYYDWVHTVSADHSSCPYSFAFFTAMIALPNADCFPDIQSKYLAQDLCRHLATMCRQYNDFGSLLRDRAESNLNSVNFPEFHLHQVGEHRSDGKVIPSSDESAKAALFEIAQYEREYVAIASAKLEKIVSPDVMNALKLFVDVTDLFGQIYVARDIAIRLR